MSAHNATDSHTCGNSKHSRYKRLSVSGSQGDLRAYIRKPTILRYWDSYEGRVIVIYPEAAPDLNTTR